MRITIPPRWIIWILGFLLLWNNTPGALNQDWYDFDAKWRWDNFVFEQKWGESVFDFEIRMMEEEKDESVRTDGKDVEDETGKEVVPSTEAGVEIPWYK